MLQEYPKHFFFADSDQQFESILVHFYQMKIEDNFLAIQPQHHVVQQTKAKIATSGNSGGHGPHHSPG